MTMWTPADKTASRKSMRSGNHNQYSLRSSGIVFYRYVHQKCPSIACRLQSVQLCMHMYVGQCHNAVVQPSQDQGQYKWQQYWNEFRYWVSGLRLMRMEVCVKCIYLCFEIYCYSLLLLSCFKSMLKWPISFTAHNVVVTHVRLWVCIAFLRRSISVRLLLLLLLLKRIAKMWVSKLQIACAYIPRYVPYVRRWGNISRDLNKCCSKIFWIGPGGQKQLSWLESDSTINTLYKSSNVSYLKTYFKSYFADINSSNLMIIVPVSLNGILDTSEIQQYNYLVRPTYVKIPLYVDKCKQYRLCSYGHCEGKGRYNVWSSGQRHSWTIQQYVALLPDSRTNRNDRPQ